MPYLTLPYLTLPYLTLPYGSPHVTLPYLTLPYLTLPYGSPHVTLPYLTLPYLTLPYLTLPYLTLPYLTLPYLTLPYGSPHVTLPYLNPPYLFSQFSKLAEPTVWKDAATQMFYSISVGFGAMITFASYNPIHNNVVRDAIIIVSLDAATCIFAGVIVFSILGYRQHLTGIPVAEVSVHIKQKENFPGVTAKYLINRHIVLVYTVCIKKNGNLRR